MCAGVVTFFAGVGVVAEKDEGEMSTNKTKDLQIILRSLQHRGHLRMLVVR